MTYQVFNPDGIIINSLIRINSKKKALLVYKNWKNKLVNPGYYIKKCNRKIDLEFMDNHCFLLRLSGKDPVSHLRISDL